MGCDDQGTIASVKLFGAPFKSVESVSVNDQRQLTLCREQTNELRRIGMTREPGADGDDALVFLYQFQTAESVERDRTFGCLRERLGHQLGGVSRNGRKDG